MFKRLMKMKEDKKGFTLAELLIVVAIIGVLVAISVPIFTAQLKKATVATNQANARSAKAAAVTAYLEEGTQSADLIISYNVATGASATTTVAAGSAIDINIPSWNASTTGAADATHKVWYVTVGKDSGEVTSISYTDKSDK